MSTSMQRPTNPFSPATVAGLLLVGATAFLLMLYAIGAGWTGEQRAVTGHARSNALDGFAALALLLEARGHEVEIARDPATARQSNSLLVLTPGFQTDPQRLDEIIKGRLWTGPTLVILPKWQSYPLPDNTPASARSDWVGLGIVPGVNQVWLAQVESLSGLTIGNGQAARWQGLGLAGPLPDPERIQAIRREKQTALVPLVTDTQGNLLAGYANRGGYHPELAEATGISFPQEEEAVQSDGMFPLLIVAEPDLMNNYGMADETRARAAVALIKLAMEGQNVPVVFDLTLPGLGASENLLTLAFRPPFLAATLCLLLAAAVIAWRAFHRFGPPVAELPAVRQGKALLASNSGRLIERARRWHLLGKPYAALVAARIDARLNLRASDPDAREAAIDKALTARGIAGPDFAATAAALRQARRPADILRAAQALRSIERMLDT